MCTDIDNDVVVRYEFYAQNRNGQLVIKNLEQENYFICTAHEILANPELLKNFPPVQAARIVAIGGSELAEHAPI